jgi:hypothetical protein
VLGTSSTTQPHHPVADNHGMDDDALKSDDNAEPRSRVMTFVRRGRFRWALLAVAMASAACTTKQQNTCKSDSDCTNPAYPFCDVNGEFAASGGEKNVCTIVPPDCPVERCGCSPGATTCAGEVLTTCDVGGMSVTTSSCALGCSADGTRCLSFEPSNGLRAALAAAANEPAVTIPDGATIDTDTGEVKTSGGIAVPVGSLGVAQGAGTIRALIGSSFVIGNVVVYGTNPLAIVSIGDVAANGILDASANSSTNGPGAQTTGACVGAQSTLGGSGGGNATPGGDGGKSHLWTAPHALGGAAQSQFEPLLGGCPGGALTGNAPGGGGGGAVQVVSLTAIRISGSIDVGGGGGGNNGGGGGAGGNVVLEAPHVEISGGVFANGGSGGACSMEGSDASRDATAVSGPGPCGNGNTIHGGTGGSVSVAPSSGGRLFIGDSGSAGGGGGALGRLKIATRDGTYDAAMAVLSAATTASTLVGK